MTRLYTIGETPEKVWRQDRWRTAWLAGSVAALLLALRCFRIAAAQPSSGADSVWTVVPLIIGVLLLTAGGVAAYRGWMRGRFADEHPAMFGAKPAPATIVAAPRAGLFADPIQQALPNLVVEPEQAPPERRFCPYCGQGVAPDHSFCAFCGRSLV